MHIQEYSDTIRYNQAYSGIVQEYSGIFTTLCNHGIIRTLAYSKPGVYLEPWYIQNQYSEPQVYLESCQISVMERFAKIFNGYNYFCKL